MIGKQILGSKPVPLSTVRRILEKKKEEGELTYEQKVTLEYVSEFGKDNQKKVEETIEKLIEEGIDEKMAVKIVDIKPKTKEEVRLIFEKTKNQPGEELTKKIINLCNKL